MTDPNLNQVQTAYDALGMVVKTLVMGKTSESLGDTLTDPTISFDYSLLNWQNAGLPAFVHSRATRDTRYLAGPALPGELHVLGRVRAGGDEERCRRSQGRCSTRGMTGTISPRWVGTGRIVFNNKGQPS